MADQKLLAKSNNLFLEGYFEFSEQLLVKRDLYTF